MRMRRAGLGPKLGTLGFGAALLGVAFGIGAIAAAGCDRQADPAPAPAVKTPSTPPSAIYTVRGRVEALPDPANPMSAFEVQHEAIDNFVDASGEVVGMGHMIMPFPLAEGVSVADLQRGDVVEVTFAVWWEPRRHWEATQIVKLPPDTPLEFRPARPPVEGPAGAPETGTGEAVEPAGESTGG